MYEQSSGWSLCSLGLVRALHLRTELGRRESEWPKAGTDMDVDIDIFSSAAIDRIRHLPVDMMVGEQLPRIC